MRLGRVSVKQEKLFGEILIVCSDQPQEGAEPRPSPA